MGGANLASAWNDLEYPPRAKQGHSRANQGHDTPSQGKAGPWEEGFIRLTGITANTIWNETLQQLQEVTFLHLLGCRICSHLQPSPGTHPP